MKVRLLRKIGDIKAEVGDVVEVDADKAKVLIDSKGAEPVDQTGHWSNPPLEELVEFKDEPEGE